MWPVTCDLWPVTGDLWRHWNSTITVYIVVVMLFIGINYRIFFTHTEVRIILFGVASLGIYFLNNCDLTGNQKYYIVCTSALMFFTHTGFRILGDVSDD